MHFFITKTGTVNTTRTLSKILPLLLCAVVHTTDTPAQQPFSNSHSEAICGATSCETGFNSVGLNPAGASCSKAGLSASYNNRFFMKELSQKSAAAALPTATGTFTSTFNYYGFQLFNQIKASLGYAMKLTDNICAGATANYHSTHIDDTPDHLRTATGDIGLIAKPHKKLRIGFFIENITNSQYRTGDTIIPVRIQTGIQYILYGGHRIIIDIEKTNMDSEILVHGAVTSPLNDKISIMAGIHTLPLTIGAGTEFHLGKLLMTFAAKRTEYLGWITSATVGWCMGERESARKEQ